MKKLLSNAVFMSLGFASGNGLVSACDKPTITTVTISQQYEVADCDESKAIIDRLEKALAANAKTISSALVDQKRAAEEIAARVARWVEAEKVLLAEVSQLQEQHVNDVDSKLTKDAAKESDIATRLANTVEKMLATAKTAPSDSTEQVLVEVDAVL